MRVSVRSQGGVLGVTRTVLVADGAVEVTEEGVTRSVGHLDEATAARVGELATLVSKQQIASGGGAADDAMVTDIQIDDAGERRSVSVKSGDDAPDEVWELLKLVRIAAG